MENNNQGNYPYNNTPENAQYPNNSYPGNVQYPTGAPQQPVQTPQPQHTNPYGAPAQGAPQYSNPYGTPAQGAPQYSNPYGTPAPEAPQYANPYAPSYTNPYGAPVVVPPKKKTGLLIGLIAGGAALLIIIVALLIYFNSDSYNYGKAQDLMAEGNYDEAIAIYTELGDYEDSSAKIIECNRRSLFSYLVNNGSVYKYISDSKAELEADEENDLINLWYIEEDDGFLLEIDMSSDEAYFTYLWEATSGDKIVNGYCCISELTTNNSLETNAETSSMQDLTDMHCDWACEELGNLLDATGLGLTPADIGFFSLN